MTNQYPKTARREHPQDSIVTVGNAALGGGHFQIIAGPCAVESAEQIEELAVAVRDAGATLLRGGAFKPRTSPYDYQGSGAKGLRWLARAGHAAGLPVVSEIMDVSQLSYFDEIDVIQVGARAMQNFALLKELAKHSKPVLIKRGPGCTIDELLGAAEYLLNGGNQQVLLCERGIRTFEPSLRYTFDVGAIPVLHAFTHLPVVADPSHAAGAAAFVPPLARAAVAAGADGLLLEVHNCPNQARCDSDQALTVKTFAALCQQVQAIRAALRQEQA